MPDRAATVEALSKQLAGKRLNCELVCSIAHCLDDGGVPNVLFGHIMLWVLGVSIPRESIDFVIPDDKESDARDLLSLAGLAPCPNPQTCSLPVDGFHFRPMEHFHIPEVANVRLFAQSDTLWMVPHLDVAPDELHAEKQFFLTSDPAVPPYIPQLERAPENIRSGGGSGPGPWNSLYGVRMPTAQTILEASLLNHWQLMHQGSSSRKATQALVHFGKDWGDISDLMLQRGYRPGVFDTELLRQPFRDYVLSRLNKADFASRCRKRDECIKSQAELYGW